MHRSFPRDNFLEFYLEIGRTSIQIQEYGLRRLSCGVFILTLQEIRGIINSTYYGSDIVKSKFFTDKYVLKPKFAGVGGMEN